VVYVEINQRSRRRRKNGPSHYCGLVLPETTVLTRYRMSQNEEATDNSSTAREPEVALALRKVIQDRRLSKDILETEEFDSILTNLRKKILDGSPSEVWICLSLAGRAASHSKSMGTV
jgi:hypothetical protein